MGTPYAGFRMDKAGAILALNVSCSATVEEGSIFRNQQILLRYDVTVYNSYGGEQAESCNVFMKDRNSTELVATLTKRPILSKFLFMNLQKKQKALYPSTCGLNLD